MVKSKTVIQRHHISYNPEWTELVYKGEHWILSQMNRRKRVSRGFLACLQAYIARHQNTAVQLKERKK